jgi:hypothetical protein
VRSIIKQLAVAASTESLTAITDLLLHHRLVQWATLLVQGGMSQEIMDVLAWEPTVPFPGVQSLSQATQALLDSEPEQHQRPEEEEGGYE